MMPAFRGYAPLYWRDIFICHHADAVIIFIDHTDTFVDDLMPSIIIIANILRDAANFSAEHCHHADDAIDICHHFIAIFHRCHADIIILMPVTLSRSSMLIAHVTGAPPLVAEGLSLMLIFRHFINITDLLISMLSSMMSIRLLITITGFN